MVDVSGSVHVCVQNLGMAWVIVSVFNHEGSGQHVTTVFTFIVSGHSPVHNLVKSTESTTL